MFIKFTLVSEPEIIRFRKEYDKNGNAIYTESSRVDRKQYINSFRNNSSLDAVLSRISYLPIHDKISSLNVVNNTTYGDTSILPKDGTEAIMLVNKYKSVLPDISKRLEAGENVDSIIKDIFTPKKIDNKESVVVENGKD